MLHLIRYPLGLTVITASLLFSATQSFAQIVITGGTINITAAGTVFAPSQPNGVSTVSVSRITVNNFDLSTQQGKFSSNAGNQFNTTSFDGTSSVIPNTDSALLSGDLKGTFSGMAFGPDGSPIMFSNIPSTMTGSVVVTAPAPVNTNGSYAFATGIGTGKITSGVINTSGTPIKAGLLDSQLSFTGSTGQNGSNGTGQTSSGSPTESAGQNGSNGTGQTSSGSPTESAGQNGSNGTGQTSSGNPTESNGQNEPQKVYIPAIPFIPDPLSVYVPPIELYSPFLPNSSGSGVSTTVQYNNLMASGQYDFSKKVPSVSVGYAWKIGDDSSSSDQFKASLGVYGNGNTASGSVTRDQNGNVTGNASATVYSNGNTASGSVTRDQNGNVNGNASATVYSNGNTASGSVTRDQNGNVTGNASATVYSNGNTASGSVTRDQNGNVTGNASATVYSNGNTASGSVTRDQNGNVNGNASATVYSNGNTASGSVTRDQNGNVNGNASATVYSNGNTASGSVTRDQNGNVNGNASATVYSNGNTASGSVTRDQNGNVNGNASATVYSNGNTASGSVATGNQNKPSDVTGSKGGGTSVTFEEGSTITADQPPLPLKSSIFPVPSMQQ